MLNLASGFFLRIEKHLPKRGVIGVDLSLLSGFRTHAACKIPDGADSSAISKRSKFNEVFRRSLVEDGKEVDSKFVIRQLQR